MGILIDAVRRFMTVKASAENTIIEFNKLREDNRRLITGEPIETPFFKAVRDGKVTPIDAEYGIRKVEGEAEAIKAELSAQPSEFVKRQAAQRQARIEAAEATLLGAGYTWDEGAQVWKLWHGRNANHAIAYALDMVAGGMASSAISFLRLFKDRMPSAQFELDAYVREEMKDD